MRRRTSRGPGPARGRALVALGLGVAAALVAEPALTARLTVPTTKAQLTAVGHRTFALTSGPTYSSTLGILTAVSFSVTPAAGSANARVRTTLSSTAEWVPCTTSDGGTSWRCDLSSLSISLLDSGRSFAWVAVR